MKVGATSIDGVLEMRGDVSTDERGDFSTVFLRSSLVEFGVDFDVAQVAVSHNRARRTLRGMHFQSPPHAESKVVRCLSGSLFDVAVDLRIDSPSYRQVFTTVLNGGDGRALLIPTGCAHGFLTLADDTSVLYLLSEGYSSATASGVRWNDPGISIPWPAPPDVMSLRDRSLPDYDWGVV